MGVPEKWLAVNQLIRDERIAVLAIQETHLTEDRVTALNSLFCATMRVVACLEEDNPTGARGVAFALNKRLVNTEDVEVKSVLPGRAMLLKINWTQGRTLTFLNVYAPNDAKDNATFWTTLEHEATARRMRRPDFMLGDFNVVEDSLDRLPPRRDPSEATEALSLLRQRLGLVDGWREREPSTRMYTYLQSSTGSQSRIDRIYATNAILRVVNDWDTKGPGISTDHRMAMCSITNPTAPHVGKGRWMVPAVLLSDKVFVEDLHKCGLALQHEIDNQKERTQGENPQVAYSRFKKAITELARARAKQCIPKLDKRINALKKDLNGLLNKPDLPTDEDKNNAAILQEKLIELEMRRFGRKRTIVAVNDWAQGETICKYWTRLNATPLPSTVIPELLETLPSGEKRSVKRSDGMAELAMRHYNGLQRDDDLRATEQETATAEVLESIDTVVSTHEKGDMSRRLTDREVDEAIRASANGKAAGLDGLPTELWKLLLHRYRAAIVKKRPGFNIVRTLRLVFNDIEEYGIVEDTGFANGWICPIYKLKKDVREIVNYRPITLLNSDYKIMTRALANRVAKVAPRIIHPDQAGFVPGRQIFDHIKLNKLIIDYAEAEEVNGVIVALDQEKAYDRIDHAYLWECLRRFNFPENFITTVRHLYAAANSVVAVNGVMSEWFKIVRGVRQGDPLSCLLFDVAIEPLACMLRKSPLQGILIPGVADRLIAKLFADDTTTYLGEHDNYDHLAAILRKWCTASRAKFNEGKTEYIPIGSKDFRTAMIERRSNAMVARTLPSNAHLVRDGIAIRSLGAWIGNEVDPLTPWTPVIETIRARLERWDKRHPTMYGRKLAVGMDVGGRTQFLTRAQGMPLEIEKKLVGMIALFVWNGDRHPRIERETLYKPIDEGGLNLLDVEARNEAVDLIWLREYLNLTPIRPLWAFVADVLIARAAQGASRVVEANAKENVFLQSWRASTRQGSHLPEDLKRMLNKACKYGVTVDSPNPSWKIKQAMPVWYHIGKADMRVMANSKSGKCLREIHNVRTVLDCTRVASRLPIGGGGRGTAHRPSPACRCPQCSDDRTIRGCDNPHRCAEAAKRVLDNLVPLWQGVQEIANDGLTLTKRRLERNETARLDGGRILFNPSITDNNFLADIFRVFTHTQGTGRTQPVQRQRRAFQVQNEEVEVYTDGSCDANGTRLARAGSGVWFGPNDERNRAARVPGTYQTNQTAEAHAVAIATSLVPPFAPLHIVSDSKYLVEGLTKRLPDWEKRGWLGIANAGVLQDLAVRLRARSAITTFRWVKGHSGVEGNESADRLASRGAESTELSRLPVANLDFLRRGASLRWITQKLAYKGIRVSKSKEERKATSRMIETIQDALQDAFGSSPTPKAIWKGIRGKDVPRKMRDFWWKATHNALRIGTFWSHIPGYELRSVCAVCGCEESLEHIMLECDAPGPKHLWREADAALLRAGIPAENRNVALLLGTPAATHPGIPRTKQGRQRLRRIILMETTHLLWKLRCERVIQHEGDPEQWPSTEAVRHRWWQALNRRLRIDQGLTARRLDKKALDRSVVIDTWEPLLVNRSDLPDDWIGRPGVLVGRLEGDARTGVG